VLSKVTLNAGTDVLTMSMARGFIGLAVMFVWLRLAQNLARLDLTAEIVAADVAQWRAGPFDAVLLDAPCSSTGTIRRHPDIPWLKREADIAALAALPDAIVVQSLIVTHALARGVLPAMSMSLPYARKDGLAANAGRPDSVTTATAAAFALVIALLSLPWREALCAALLAVASAIGMAWLAQRQIGGQTGDVLGGAEQAGETAILVLLATRLG